MKFYDPFFGVPFSGKKSTGGGILINVFFGGSVLGTFLGLPEIGGNVGIYI